MHGNIGTDERMRQAEEHRAIRARMEAKAVRRIEKKTHECPSVYFYVQTVNHGPRPAIPASLCRIMGEVAEKHGFTFAQICSARRHKPLVIARHEFFYRARQETTHSFPRIADSCGGRDHTTAMAGARQHEKRMQANG